jgi:potassium-transporting ATPase ATP-binding subunit
MNEEVSLFIVHHSAFIVSGVIMSEKAQKRPLFDPAIVKRAIKDAFTKLNPKQVAKNPVMFVVEIGSVLTTLLIIRDLAIGQTGNLLFTVQVTL